MKKEIVSIGIDPSLSKTAFVATKNGLVVEVQSVPTEGIRKTLMKSKIQVDEMLARQYRFREINRSFIPFVYRYKPNIIILESYSFGSKFQLASQGETTAMIMLTIFNYMQKFPNTTFISFPPTTMKKFVTGKGNCNKSLVLKEVFRKFNFNTDDDNEADAFGLSIIGYCCQYYLFKGLFPIHINESILNKEQQKTLLKNKEFIKLLKNKV